VKEQRMAWKLRLTMVAALAVAGCNEPQPQQNVTKIKVRSAEQERLHQLDAFNLAIGLKHAIYDAGYTCKRIDNAGFVGEYKNLDMWTAHCLYDQGAARDWAIFAGPDGSAQVRDCKDVVATGLPACAIKVKPKGNFSEAK
jgi:hypothetical protein